MLVCRQQKYAARGYKSLTRAYCSGEYEGENYGVENDDSCPRRDDGCRINARFCKTARTSKQRDQPVGIKTSEETRDLACNTSILTLNSNGLKNTGINLLFTEQLTLYLQWYKCIRRIRVASITASVDCETV